MHGGTDPHYSLVNLLGVLEPSLGLDLIDHRSSYWLNSDLFTPQKLACRSKMADLSPPSKFAQQSEYPINRIFNFEAFKVI